MFLLLKQSKSPSKQLESLNEKGESNYCIEGRDLEGRDFETRVRA